MHQERLEQPRFRDKLVRLAVCGSVLLSACGASQEAVVDEPSTTSSAAGEVTTSETQPTTTTSIDTTSTTLAPETTTTTIPLPEWYDRIYVDNGCDDGTVMMVIVKSEDGRNITAQVSYDFDSKLDGSKPGEDGQPIEDRYQHYSGFRYINEDLPPEGSFTEGIDRFCIENIPEGVSVHIEVYNLEIDYSRNPHGEPKSTERFFGNARSGEIYPGKNQVAQVYLPKTCRPEDGWYGDAGEITFHPFIDGVPAESKRAVGWAMHGADTHYGRSIGFAAEDVIYNETLQEKKLPALVPNQRYVAQIRIINPFTGQVHEVVIREIPVEPCTNTNVNVAIIGGLCVAGRDYDQLEFPCEVDGEYIG